MDTQTTSIRTRGLLTLFDLHTDYFIRVLEGISEDDMHNRLNTKANHPAWLAGSLVGQRFNMASETGSGMKQTAEELFKNNQGIQAGVKYPSNEEYIRDWKKITPEAREALVKIDDKKLDSDFEMEGMKMSYYDLITYSIFREASVLGQLILWRRLLGYPAMKYD